jgi:hypothetical protein
MKKSLFLSLTIFTLIGCGINYETIVNDAKQLAELNCKETNLTSLMGDKLNLSMLLRDSSGRGGITDKEIMRQQDSINKITTQIQTEIDSLSGVANKLKDKYKSASDLSNLKKALTIESSKINCK